MTLSERFRRISVKETVYKGPLRSLLRKRTNRRQALGRPQLNASATAIVKAEFQILEDSPLRILDLVNALRGSVSLLETRPGTMEKYQLLCALDKLNQGTHAQEPIESWKDARRILSTVVSLSDIGDDDDDDEKVPPEQQEASTDHQPITTLTTRKKHPIHAALEEFNNRMRSISLKSTDVGLRQSQRHWFSILKSKKRPEKEPEPDPLTLAQQAAMSILSTVSDDDCRYIRETMRGGHPEEIVAQHGSHQVTRRTLASLDGGQWVNDSVISCYLDILTNRDAAEFPDRRSHFFNSFFVTKLRNEGHATKDGVYEYSNVKRWSKKVPGKNLFALDKIFVPVNQNNVHWTLAVIYMNEQRIQFYDSLGGSGRDILEVLLQYLQDEHRAKQGSELPGDWTLVDGTNTPVRQANGFDCGVFLCMFCDFLSMDRPLVFTQEHVTACRNYMAMQILGPQRQ